ncbi:MAG: winged helix-turn-helix domain-containing protein [Pirellulaceae bacterium]
MLHRGKLITRTAIYDHIFNVDDDSLSNLVDVHISHIRKKLGMNFVETRRGRSTSCMTKSLRLRLQLWQ